MKCRRCGIRWDLGNTREVPKLCPICDADISDGLRSIIMETPVELMYYMIDKEGIEVARNGRLRAYIMDVFPKDDIIKKAWIVGFENGLESFLYKGLKKKYSRDYVRKSLSKIFIGFDSENLLDGICFLLCIDTVPGSDFTQDEFYIQVYKDVQNNEIKKTALRKAVSVCNVEKKNNILWELATLEYDTSDIKVEDTLRELMEEEDVRALLKLVNIYENGIVLEKNRKAAFDLLKRGEELGNSEILFQLGRYYTLGWSGEMDLEIGEDYFKRSAKMNNPKACYQIYNIGIRSHGLDTELIELLSKAVTAGYRPAIHEYAMHLFWGDGIEKNRELASQLLEENANGGYEPSRCFFKYVKHSGM